MIRILSTKIVTIYGFALYVNVDYHTSLQKGLVFFYTFLQIMHENLFPYILASVRLSQLFKSEPTRCMKNLSAFLFLLLTPNTFLSLIGTCISSMSSSITFLQQNCYIPVSNVYVIKLIKLFYLWF